ncbi:hypothetical protein FF011L_12490 [Roseimaritima multifibrata]|uniref:VWFA domain-containing protein n=1 Tax=Roseimaritima multifibrata TaxID=1930274 RepID=A0A517MC84_9BACT|nr:hypothetical protein [Roseimaritima multifibrata]QDS92503.1 hypothetical protein FF011L_12490 [Roseimaritima multifibrata]
MLNGIPQGGNSNNHSSRNADRNAGHRRQSGRNGADAKPERSPPDHGQTELPKIGFKPVAGDSQYSPCELTDATEKMHRNCLPIEKISHSERNLKNLAENPGHYASVISQHQQIIASHLVMLEEVEACHKGLQEAKKKAKRRRDSAPPHKTHYSWNPRYRKQPGATSRRKRKSWSRLGILTFPSFRKWLGGFTDAGWFVVAIACMFAVIPLISVPLEFQLFATQITAGPLFDLPGATKTAPTIQPGFWVCASACFAPLICMLIGLKVIKQPGFFWSDQVTKWMGISLFLGALLALWFFAFVTCSTPGSSSITNRLPPSSSGLHWSLVALLSSVMALTNTFAISWAWDWFSKLLEAKVTKSVLLDQANQDLRKIGAAFVANQATKRQITGFLERCKSADPILQGALDKARQRLSSEQELAETLRSANTMLDHVNELLAKLKGGQTLAWMGFVLALTLGCHNAPPLQDGNQQAGAAAELPEIEYFVFDNGDFAPSTVRELLKDMVLSRLPGGARLYVVHGSDRNLAAAIDVPYGDQIQREANPYFAAEWQGIESFYSNPPVPTETTPSVIGIARSVQDLRRNKQAPCKIVCLGSIVYHDPEYAGFSMRNHQVPSTGWIGDKSGPFTDNPSLPRSTQVECFVPSGKVGDNLRHGQLIRDFSATYIASLNGAHLTRISPDLSLAGMFSESFMPVHSGQPAGEQVIIDTRVEDDVLPVETPRSREIITVPFDASALMPRLRWEEGSLQQVIQDGGGDPTKLSAMSCDVFVCVDGSGSMVRVLRDFGSTLDRICDDLGPVLGRLRIGVLVISDKASRQFPLQIVTGGSPSRAKLKEFTTDIGPLGGDPEMGQLIHAGSEAIKTGSTLDPNRRILIVASDYINGDITDLSSKVERWLALAPACNRVLAVCTSAEKSAQFQQLCNSENARAASGTDALIEELTNMTK